MTVRSTETHRIRPLCARQAHRRPLLQKRVQLGNVGRTLHGLFAPQRRTVDGNTRQGGGLLARRLSRTGKLVHQPRLRDFRQCIPEAAIWSVRIIN